MNISGVRCIWIAHFVWDSLRMTLLLSPLAVCWFLVAGYVLPSLACQRPETNESRRRAWSFNVQVSEEIRVGWRPKKIQVCKLHPHSAVPPKQAPHCEHLPAIFTNPATTTNGFALPKFDKILSVSPSITPESKECGAFWALCQHLQLADSGERSNLKAISWQPFIANGLSIRKDASKFSFCFPSGNFWILQLHNTTVELQPLNPRVFEGTRLQTRLQDKHQNGTMRKVCRPKSA